MKDIHAAVHAQCALPLVKLAVQVGRQLLSTQPTDEMTGCLGEGEATATLRKIKGQ